MCFDDADWKREEIPDHKFDYVDIEDFVDESLMRKLSYMTVFFLTLQSILVYVADLGAVILLIATNGFDNVLSGNGNTTTDASTLNIKRTFQIDSKIKIILIVASVFVSFVLLFIEWYKARAIIRSRDISYAFTSKTAYRFYAIRSYAYYCFFYQIQNSRKTTDLVAFFVYFRFKNWKRLVFAEAPRQILNVFFLIDVTKAVYIRYPKTSILTFFGNLLTGLQPEAVVGKSQDLVTFLNFMVLLFTFTIWGVGMLALIGAFFVYIPLLFTIRGNLKEYCVHKIDKRYNDLI